MIEDVEPRQVAERMRSSQPPVLVDVREDWERGIAALPGSVHIAMGQIPQRLSELPRDREIVLYCHHGGRSRQVAQWLEWQGYDRLANLQGGIDEWSQTVDPEIPRY